MKILTKPASAEPKRLRRDTGFGSRIKLLRLDRGLTLQQLAKRSELSASTISKVEQNPDFADLRERSQIGRRFEGGCG